MLTRFAPAPTGLLRLGHVVNAIHVWGLGRRLGARVLLRVEDHDRQRSRASFEAAMLEDLDWLGFAPDLFPTPAFRHGPCLSRQSDRDAVYRSRSERLAARGLIYGCTCSRRDSAGTVEGSGARYPGTCRDRGIPPGDGVVWRVRLDEREERFDDLLAGPQCQQPSALFGDPVVRDRAGNWTYQFAVAVDDLEQSVDLVIRGRDLLSSTGLQVALARMLGRATPPTFAHHLLVMKTLTQKLSKSDGDTGIAAFRAGGVASALVIGMAASVAGLIPTPEPVAADAVADLFADGGQASQG